jgi:hypothetical protein
MDKSLEQLDGILIEMAFRSVKEGDFQKLEAIARIVLALKDVLQEWKPKP